jgi:NADH-quinone oxidoreductase subunit E
VGVCTNTLCAVLGGDALFAAAKEHLGIGNNETTPDGSVSLEHIECNAACDYAPVVMVNWEFYDGQTPQSARELVDACRAGSPPPPTRGPASLPTFKEVARVLAGFNDGRGAEGVSAGPASLVGLELAKARGDQAPSYPGQEG